MLQTENVSREIARVVRRASPEVPPLLEALRLLGISNATIARHLNVSEPLCSHWARLKAPIAKHHYPKLMGLLREAHEAAVRTLGELASKVNPPEVERSFVAYRDRVWRAGEILRELEHREVQGR